MTFNWIVLFFSLVNGAVSPTPFQTISVSCGCPDPDLAVVIAMENVRNAYPDPETAPMPAIARVTVDVDTSVQ